MTENVGFPRRSTLEKLSPAEKAIRDAMLAVEEAGADVLLTEAVILLAQARDKVADFVDGHPPVAQSTENALSPSGLFHCRRPGHPTEPHETRDYPDACHIQYLPTEKLPSPARCAGCGSAGPLRRASVDLTDRDWCDSCRLSRFGLKPPPADLDRELLERARSVDLGPDEAIVRAIMDGAQNGKSAPAASAPNAAALALLKRWADEPGPSPQDVKDWEEIKASIEGQPDPDISEVESLRARCAAYDRVLAILTEKQAAGAEREEVNQRQYHQAQKERSELLVAVLALENEIARARELQRGAEDQAGRAIARLSAIDWPAPTLAVLLAARNLVRAREALHADHGTAAACAQHNQEIERAFTTLRKVVAAEREGVYGV